MGLIGSDSGGAPSHFECRECGTTVDSQTTACPACGSTDIVEFDVD